MDASTKPLNRSKQYEKDLENNQREVNDKLTNQLRYVASDMKKAAEKFNTIFTKSNDKITESIKKYDNSSSSVGDTLQKLGNAISNNPNFLCYLIIFIFVGLFIIFKLS